MVYSHGTGVTLQYRVADMKGMHKMRLSPISAYRKKATAVHWKVMADVGVLKSDKVNGNSTLCQPAEVFFCFFFVKAHIDKLKTC